MSNISSKKEVVEKMLKSDYFSQWLGIKVKELKEGYCEITMTVRKEMLNGFAIAHGGIAFSLADSALAFASNTENNQAVSIEANISFIKPVHENDELTAIAEQKSFNGKIQIFDVSITNQKNEPVALFKGTVYVKL